MKKLLNVGMNKDMIDQINKGKNEQASKLWCKISFKISVRFFIKISVVNCASKKR